MIPQTIFPLFVYGVLMGLMFCFMASGLTLVFGVSKIVNSAHGAFFMLGAYTTWLLYSAGFGLIISVILGPVIVFFVGMAFQRFLVRPFMNDPHIVLVETFILAIIMEQLVRLFIGSQYIHLPPLFTGYTNILGMRILYQRIGGAVLSVIFLITLTYFIRDTKTGTALRMVSQDREASHLLGINVSRMDEISFGLGVAIVAASAVLITPLKIGYPGMGWSMFLVSFSIVIAGGLGSLSGTLIIALVYGVMDSFITYYVAPGWGLVALFIVLITILLVKPAGLMEGGKV